MLRVTSMSADRPRHPRREAPAQPKRKRLVVTSEEIDEVAGGYWSVLDSMVQAPEGSAETPLPSELPGPTRR